MKQNGLEVAFLFKIVTVRDTVSVFSIMFGCTHFFLKTLPLVYSSSKKCLRPLCCWKSRVFEAAFLLKLMQEYIVDHDDGYQLVECSKLY